MSSEHSAAAPGAAPLRLIFWPKRWLYVILLAAAVPSIQAATQLKWSHSLAAVGMALLLLDSLLRHFCGQRMQRFDAQLMAAIADGQRAELLPMYRQQSLLRFGAPKHELLAKLGLIYRTLEDHTASAAAYREAIEEAPAKVIPVLAHRLADALYAAKDLVEAEKYYRLSQDAQHVNAGVRARIARLTMERGGDLAEAEQLLRQAVEAAKGQPGGLSFRCLLIEVLVKQGKAEDATWQLQIAEEEVGDLPAEKQRLEEARQACQSTLPVRPE